VYDRGPRPDLIMDYLIKHKAEFVWGNHDILWMGAALGDSACVLNALRVNIAYNNFDLLHAYGIDLAPLKEYAARVYKDDGCERFKIKLFNQSVIAPVDLSIAAKMHKAVSMLQFKAEAELIKKNPQFEMGHRILINPTMLTKEEAQVIEELNKSFKASKSLKRHTDYLVKHGEMYKIAGSSLLFHGCVPLDENGQLLKICDFNKNCSASINKKYAGKKYFDYLNGMLAHDYDRENGGLFWYLWCGAKSPLFGKKVMATFERFFNEAQATHKEPLDPYYTYINDEKTAVMILAEFGLGEGSRIINGHIPVKFKAGESPVKSGGRRSVIDGGMAKSYQASSGIAGLCLVVNENNSIKIIENRI